MSEYELVSAYFQALGAFDGSFEFWLTVTFATLLTFHFAGTRISKQLRFLILWLYLAASILFLIRLLTFGFISTTLRDQIAALDTETGVIDVTVNSLVGLLFFLIMLGGTTGTLLYVRRIGKQSADLENR